MSRGLRAPIVLALALGLAAPLPVPAPRPARWRVLRAWHLAGELLATISDGAHQLELRRLIGGDVVVRYPPSWRGEDLDRVEQLALMAEAEDFARAGDAAQREREMG